MAQRCCGLGARSVVIQQEAATSDAERDTDPSDRGVDDLGGDPTNAGTSPMRRPARRLRFQGLGYRLPHFYFGNLKGVRRSTNSPQLIPSPANLFGGGRFAERSGSVFGPVVGDHSAYQVVESVPILMIVRRDCSNALPVRPWEKIVNFIYDAGG